MINNEIKSQIVFLATVLIWWKGNLDLTLYASPSSAYSHMREIACLLWSMHSTTLDSTKPWIQRPWIQQTWIQQCLGESILNSTTSDSTTLGYNNLEFNNPWIQQTWIQQAYNKYCVTNKFKYFFSQFFFFFWCRKGSRT